jgi:azurin
MKNTLRSLTIGALVSAALLSGCARSIGSTPDAAVTAPSTSSARAVAISADDTMKFSTTQIFARPGETLAITLTNKGAVPKVAMAHNWVLLKPGVDTIALATEGMTSPQTAYIPASAAGQILAATKLLGPGESDTVTLTVPSTPGRFPFLCTFPGHMQAGMKGELIVE